MNIRITYIFFNLFLSMYSIANNSYLRFRDMNTSKWHETVCTMSIRCKFNSGLLPPMIYNMRTSVIISINGSNNLISTGEIIAYTQSICYMMPFVY